MTGKTIGENYGDSRRPRSRHHPPLRPAVVENAGFLVVSGNLFDSALVKTSVISDGFPPPLSLRRPAPKTASTARVIVFDGPEDYRRRINDPSLEIDETCMLVVRGAGPIAYPGSAEVVNMTPPDSLARRGIRMLPCMGDGRQSGTSDTPSILNASPEIAPPAANLAILQTGDRVKVDLRNRRVDVLLERRRDRAPPPAICRPRRLKHDSPWQEFYRSHVGQLDTGACLEFAVPYRDLRKTVPRHSH